MQSQWNEGVVDGSEAIDVHNETIPYDKEVVVLCFASGDQFDAWQRNVADKHAKWTLRRNHIAKNDEPQEYLLAGRFLKNTLTYRCNHAGTPEKKKEKDEPLDRVIKRRRTGPSIKVGCTAYYNKKIYTNGEVEVVYHWQHTNHDPFVAGAAPKDPKIPPEITAWVDRAVRKHMDWKSVKTTLNLDDDKLEQLEVTEGVNRLPLILLTQYKDLQNAIIKRMNAMSQKHYSDRNSVQQWLTFLREQRNHKTLFFEHPGGPFLVSWTAPWQLELMKNAEEWCIDSTYNTCTSFNDPKTPTILFTIVIRSRITNNGIPVCFLMTDAESQPILVQWLRWVKQEAGTLSVKRIMLDSSSTEVSAIKEVFGDNVSILLCHWHMRQAWEARIKADVKSMGSLIERIQTRKNFKDALVEMMNASSQDEFEQLFSDFKEKYESRFSGFVSYFKEHWYVRKEQWVKAWRPDMTFHSNNYIQSNHNLLKTFSLDESRKRRVDRMVYILSQVIVTDYRQDAQQVHLGTKKIFLTDEEWMNKGKADSVDIDEAVYMIIENDDNSFNCRSFTNPSVSYTVLCQDNCVCRCTCPNQAGICKHLFLVSRVKMIPYSARKRVIHGSNSGVSDHVNLNEDHYTDLKQQYLAQVSRISQKLDAFLKQSNSTHDRLEEMLENMKKFEYIIDNHTAINSASAEQS